MSILALSHRGSSLLLLAVPLCLGVLGCGPSSGGVSGQVKYHGTALPSGTITFLSDVGEKQVVASDIVDGKYAVKNIQAGPAKVVVVTMPPSRGGSPPGGKGIEAPSAGPTPGQYVAIPAKYNNPDQSGLTYEIKSGSQTKDFDLAP